MITSENFGISTACLYPQLTEKCLDKLLNMGFRTFEVFVNAESEFSHSFMRELKKRADAFGATFTSVHPYTSALEGMLLFEAYDRRTDESIELYKRYMESAAVLGAEYVVIHGQRWVANPHKLLASYERYWNVFGRMYRAGHDIGAFPAQENVMGHRSANTEFIQGMREYLDDECKFVLDIKQCRISNVTEKDMINAMGKQLCHIHISDCTEGKPCILPGFGEFDFIDFFEMLDTAGYRGKLMTEVYGTSYKEEKEILQSKNLMKKIVDEYNKKVLMK